MNWALVENLHPRFRSKLSSEPLFQDIINKVEGTTQKEWDELVGQLKLLCRLKKPAVEAVIPRIRNTIAGIKDRKLRDACLQLAGQYTAIIVREELKGRNSGSKNRVSELFTRAEVFVDPAEPAKPRLPRGTFRKAHKTSEMDTGFLEELNSSEPPVEAAEFDSEFPGGS